MPCKGRKVKPTSITLFLLRILEEVAVLGRDKYSLELKCKCPQWPRLTLEIPLHEGITSEAIQLVHWLQVVWLGGLYSKGVS